MLADAGSIPAASTKQASKDVHGRPFLRLESSNHAAYSSTGHALTQTDVSTTSGLSVQFQVTTWLDTDARLAINQESVLSSSSKALKSRRQ